MFVFSSGWKIYGARCKRPSSRIEEFAQCPFRFFVHSGLRAEERKMFELDARERGSFQHEILKVFHEQLKAEGKRWRDITPPEAREWIHAIAGKLIKNFREDCCATRRSRNWRRGCWLTRCRILSRCLRLDARAI